MTRFPVGKDYRLRPELPDHSREPQFVLAARLNVRIRDAESAAPSNGEQFCRVRRLLCPDFRGTAPSHLSRSPIEDAGFVSALRNPYDSPAGGPLNILRVRGKHQAIQIQ